MTDSTPSKMFSGEPDQELAAYRGVSILAVIALLVSCVSTAALISPLLWVVPIAGIVLASVALVRIRAADPPPLGRSVALLALFMSLLFAAAAPSHFFLRQQRVVSQAEIVADEWFTFIRRQQYTAALELAAAPTEREPLDMQLDALYEADEQRQQKLKDFVDDTKNPLIRQLTLRLGAGSQPRLREVESHESSSGTDRLHLIYEVDQPSAKPADPIVVRLGLLRENDPGSARGLWRVTGWEGPLEERR